VWISADKQRTVEKTLGGFLVAARQEDWGKGCGFAARAHPTLAAQLQCVG
jgi:hypothetical protein